MLVLLKSAFSTTVGSFILPNFLYIFGGYRLFNGNLNLPLLEKWVQSQSSFCVV